jgi:hypothetical protein
MMTMIRSILWVAIIHPQSFKHSVPHDSVEFWVETQIQFMTIEDPNQLRERAAV